MGNTPTITPQAAKAAIIQSRGGVQNFALSESRLEAQTKYFKLEELKARVELDLRERNEIIKMRRQWSSWLLFAILLIVIFDVFLIIAIGAKWLTYNDHVIIPFVIGESLIKTIGLAFIVVNFLFNKDGTKISK